MTVASVQTARPAGEAGAGRRRWGLGLLLTAAAVVAVAVLAVTVSGSDGGVAGDPDSTSRGGARAIAEVLRQQGVAVEVVRTVEALESVPVGPTTTVLIGGFDYLGEAAADRATRHAAGARRFVLIEPSDLALSDLGVPLREVGRTFVDAEASCSSSVASSSDRLRGPASVYRAHGEGGGAALLPSGATGCFPTDHGASLVILPAGTRTPETVVLGSLAALTNASVARASHAALGLRALGAAPHLVWYLPSITDLDVVDSSGQHRGDADRGIPVWFGPGVLLAGLAFVAYALARGRRLGRVVAEPLPVVVRAVETTEARGRLYRRASDRGRAASGLRAGSRSRLATRLGVSRRFSGTPGQVDPFVEALVDAVARSTGRDRAEVHTLLDGPPPETDQALVLLAEQLAQLEENVRTA